MGELPAAIIADVVSNHITYVKFLFISGPGFVAFGGVLLRKNTSNGAEDEGKKKQKSIN